MSALHDEGDSCTYSAFLDSWAVWTKYDFLCSGCEVSETSDRKVFVIQVGVLSKDFIRLRLSGVCIGDPEQTDLLDDGQDPRFRIVVSISTNT